MEEQNSKSTNNRIVILVVILSLLLGTAGGFFGSFLVLSNPRLENKFGLSGASALGGSQNVTLTEDSAIINVVKKDSPAVVSIIVSQDLSKAQGGGNDPFSQDPFFNFGFGNGNEGSGSSGGNGTAAPDVEEVAAGSGFFVSSDGLILTNKHVVSTPQASYSVVTSDGKTYSAQVLSEDPVNDLALVKINITNAPFLQFADFSQLQVGQRVVAIGNSLGQYQNTVTSGIVSGIGRQVTAGSDTGSSEDLSNVIQTDAAINPGNSGGPLLNVEGQVVGINTAIDEQGQLIGFAIPSTEGSKDLASFEKYGKITRPFLGVRYEIVTSDLQTQMKLPVDYGALIVSGASADEPAITPGSPAEKAGLQENDIILEVNGQKVDENNTLSELLGNFNIGDSVTLKIQRGSNQKDVTVVLGQVQ